MGLCVCVCVCVHACVNGSVCVRVCVRTPVCVRQTKMEMFKCKTAAHPPTHTCINACTCMHARTRMHAPGLHTSTSIIPRGGHLSPESFFLICELLYCS